LPITKSAIREMHAAARKQERNKTTRSLTKTNLKRANKAISSGDAEEVKTTVVTAVSTLDRAVEKKILHKNNAARKKSRLMKKLNKAAKSTETK
jgi:small subunit ribosomal protein S20